MSFASRVARFIGQAIALGALAAAGRAQAPVRQDSITDREFWRIFTTLSEDGGAFPSENFVSNEKTYQFVIPSLQRTLTPGGVYLGVGPEQNFTYIANLEPSLAVIIDIRRQNAMLHLMYKALFELSPSRGEFVARLFSRPLPRVSANTTASELFGMVASASVSDSAFDATWTAITRRLTVEHGFAMSEADLASMRHVLGAFRDAGPGISYAYRVGAPPPTITQWFVAYSEMQTLANADGVNMAFLSTEERYLRVRDFERRNLIVPVVGDFSGAKAVRGVGEFLARRGDRVTAFYTSNVEQYLYTNGVETRFYENLAGLPCDSTAVFIRAVPGGSSGFSGSPLGNLKSVVFRVTDSLGTTITTGTGVDSTGKTVTIRLAAPNASVSAFISGTAPLTRSLDEFRAGRLKSYARLTEMTRTDGWQRP